MSELNGNYSAIGPATSVDVGPTAVSVVYSRAVRVQSNRRRVEVSQDGGLNYIEVFPGSPANFKAGTLLFRSREATTVSITPIGDARNAKSRLYEARYVPGVPLLVDSGPTVTTDTVDDPALSQLIAVANGAAPPQVEVIGRTSSTNPGTIFPRAFATGGNSVGDETARYGILTNAATVQFRGTFNNGSARVLVDGKALGSLAPFQMTNTRYKVAFGSSAWRHIEVEQYHGDFARFMVAPGDTVRKPNKHRRPAITIFGDSVAAGVGSTGSTATDSPFTGFGETLCRALGCDGQYFGDSGTGVIANNGTPGREALSRWRNDVVATGLQMDGLLVEIGYNDTAYTSAQLDAAFVAFFAEIKAYVADTPVVVLGPCPSVQKPSNDAGLIRANDSARTAALAQGWAFGECRTGKIYGSALFAGAVVQDSGASIVTAATQSALVNADNIHPNAAGAQNLGLFGADCFVKGYDLPVYLA